MVPGLRFRTGRFQGFTNSRFLHLFASPDLPYPSPWIRKAKKQRLSRSSAHVDMNPSPSTDSYRVPTDLQRPPSYTRLIPLVAAAAAAHEGLSRGNTRVPIHNPPRHHRYFRSKQHKLPSVRQRRINFLAISKLARACRRLPQLFRWRAGLSISLARTSPSRASNGCNKHKHAVLGVCYAWFIRIPPRPAAPSPHASPMLSQRSSITVPLNSNMRLYVAPCSARFPETGNMSWLRHVRNPTEAALHGAAFHGTDSSRSTTKGGFPVPMFSNLFQTNMQICTRVD